jgi:hypothetical protein
MRVRGVANFAKRLGAARLAPLLDVQHANGPAKIFARSKAVLKPPHSTRFATTEHR